MKIDIQQRFGVDVAQLVDPFYQAHGSGSRARSDDLFFLAFADGQFGGCVRFCLEEHTPMLRSMMVAEEARGQGVGQALLQALVGYLDAQGVRAVFCLPYRHLIRFYESAGFYEVGPNEIPSFLLQRLLEYRQRGLDSICMKRP